MNPLQRAGEAVGRGWHRSVRGTTRTAAWVKDGVAGSLGSARARLGGSGGDAGDSGSTPESAKPGKADAGRSQTRGGSLVERAQADRRVAIAWVAGGALLLVWICWTVYVWESNGSTAGLGVLISWPALFAAAALVALPFVGATMLVRRHQAGAEGSAAIAGGGSAAEVEAGDGGDAESGADIDGDQEAKAGEDSDQGDAEPEDGEDDGDDDSEDDDSDADDSDEDEEPEAG